MSEHVPHTNIVEAELEAQLEAVATGQQPARIPFSFAKRFGAVLVWENNKPLVHTREQVALHVLHEIRRMIGRTFSVQPHPSAEFDAILGLAYQRDSSEAKQLMEDIGNEVNLFSLAEELPKTEDLLASEDDAPIIKLINAMLSEAIKEGSSDIHIETFEKDLIIRFRIDGVLREILRPHRKLASLLVSRIKVMAQLDIAEKRVPQDGRISLLIAGRAVDVRVSTMPSNHGERVVLRLLDKNNARLDLAQLGMTAANRRLFGELIHKPHGIILVTGPTGSGKSTTLYAGLSEINTKDRNILTVEDPIEYALEGIGQTQVNPRVDMTFARGLRAILRQDPDVVMIGEIRDTETAQIAVQASLTGHLVLSTLHTNTAAGALTRLEDMGIEPFLLSSSLLAVLSQRLVRTLCKECREQHVPNDDEMALLDLPLTYNNEERPKIYRAKGCAHCNNSGYRGRTGIHEVLIVDERVRELVHKGKGEQDIEHYARTKYPGIRQDGRDKIIQGITSLEEVMRVTRED
ncbi:MAG TPA: type II secretion system ATPase GspE [Aliidiomarina sp.]|nr:type II secretion system ATPase GspE [Aliidiomarina sp.]